MMSARDRKDVLDILRESGHLRLECESYDEFNAVVAGLGESFAIADISFKEGAKAKLSSRSSMSMHTDHPKADFVAWFCVQPAVSGGLSILVDSREILRALSPAERECLRSVMIGFPIQKDMPRKERALLSGEHIYYADWLVKRPTHPDVFHLLRKFENAISTAPRVTYALQKNSALFIDNRRMLHGRSEFVDEGSQRLLKRHWISRNERPQRAI